MVGFHQSVEGDKGESRRKDLRARVYKMQIMHLILQRVRTHKSDPAFVTWI